MTKEEVYKIYGIDNDTLLNYEDIVDAYIENITCEISFENLNKENIEKIVDGYSYLHSIFYPEYEENTSEKTATEIYAESHPHMFKMINLTATLLLKIDDNLTFQNAHLLIRKIENNLERDYYARVEEPKKIKRLH